VASDCLKNPDKLMKVDTLIGELDTKSDAAAAVHWPYMSTAGRKGKHAHRRLHLGHILDLFGLRMKPSPQSKPGAAVQRRERSVTTHFLPVGQLYSTQSREHSDVTPTSPCANAGRRHRHSKRASYQRLHSSSWVCWLLSAACV
jgi:hypothetical protein